MVSLRSRDVGGNDQEVSTSQALAAGAEADTSCVTSVRKSVRVNRRNHTAAQNGADSVAATLPGDEVPHSPTAMHVAADLDQRLALTSPQQRAANAAQPSTTSSVQQPPAPQGPAIGSQTKAVTDPCRSPSTRSTRRSAMGVDVAAQMPAVDMTADDGTTADDEAGSSDDEELAEESDDELLQAMAANMFASLTRSSDADRTASDDMLSAADPDVEHLRWEPETGLPAPLDEDVAVASTSALGKEPGLAKQLLARPRDRRLAAKAARTAKPDTAGKDWFDLPATPITDEVKRDLRMLRLRGAMDPKRFYKSFDNTKFPKYFQMGTIVETPADFYSGRMTRRERKQTLTEELLADGELTRIRKKRYGALQEEAQRWSRKRHGRKTDKPRLKGHRPRPKH